MVEQQGESQHSTIPSLQTEDDEMAHSALDKANLLAKHFVIKMCIPNPERIPPTLLALLTVLVKTSESEVKIIFRKVNVGKQWGQTKLALIYFICVLMSW